MNKEQKSDQKKADENANVFFAEFLVIKDKKTNEEIYRGRG